MRGGGPANLYIKVGGAGHPAGGRPGPAAPLPGGLGGQPPRCRATGPPGTRAQIFCESFCRKTPTARQRGGQVTAARQQGGRVYFCKFRKQKYIFVKNEIEKCKNKKSAGLQEAAAQERSRQAAHAAATAHQPRVCSTGRREQPSCPSS